MRQEQPVASRASTYDTPSINGFSGPRMVLGFSAAGGRNIDMSARGSHIPAYMLVNAMLAQEPLPLVFDPVEGDS